MPGELYQVNSKTTLLLASECSAWCDGVHRLMADTEFEIVGETPCGSRLLEAVMQARPAMLLLNLSIADGDGLEQLSTLKAAYPRMAVVLLTTMADTHFMVHALNAGAAGCLLQGMNGVKLLDALRAI